MFVDGNMPVSVPKDIEDEANSYFQRIYNLAPHHSLSIDEVLEMLKRFQESPVKRERVNMLNYLNFIKQMPFITLWHILIAILPLGLYV